MMAADHEVAIADIKIGARFRKAIGDLDALASSIQDRGLLQEIVIDSDGNLVAGFRRLSACKKLGWKTIRAYRAKNLKDAAEKIKAERDENTQRLDMTPTEKWELGKELERLERPKAEDRRDEGRTAAAEKWANKKPPKQDGKASGKISTKPSPASSGDQNKTRNIIGQSLGMSGKSWDKLDKVMTSKDKAAKAELERTGKIDRAFKTLRENGKKKGRAAKARQVAKSLPSEDDYGVKIGDFREIARAFPDGSVDLIFTDPPYDRKTLPLYEDMAREAARVLCDGGSLICYLGQYQIHEVLDLVSLHLRLWWTLAVQHTGRKARMREYGVVVHWKPLLWFVKNTRGDKETFVDDLVVSQMEKDDHDWQQSLLEARYYIEKLCPPGGLVFDPFAGGGTTAVAAKQVHRRWIACDIDEASVILARKRISETGE